MENVPLMIPVAPEERDIVSTVLPEIPNDPLEIWKSVPVPPAIVRVVVVSALIVTEALFVTTIRPMVSVAVFVTVALA
jgi:hypothetical protein